MEDRGEVCLEEKVDRLRRSGMSVREIADLTGLESGWIETVVEMLPEDTPNENGNRT